MNAIPDENPFSRLAGVQRRIHERGQHRCYDGVKIDELADAGRRLEAVAHSAAEMELGADGFDNTDMSRRYRLVQAQLHNAAQALVAACELLEEGATAD